MIIYCCKCEKDMECRLTTGAEIYPHRGDLAHLPFWRCSCGGFVGCHHKSKEPTKPLGVIPTEKLKNLRKQIHRLIDPLWQQKLITRRNLYKKLSNAIGREYHTATLASESEAYCVLATATALRERLTINSRPGAADD